MMNSPLWISEAEVDALIDPLALVEAVEAGFLAAAEGRIREPGSMRIDALDGRDAYLTLYPSHAEGERTTVKILAGRPANAKEHRPEIDAVVAVVDPPTGRIAALIGARALTAWRTAAATAAVLKRLMPAAPAAIGLLGTGIQTKIHARMLHAAGLASRFAIASPRGHNAKAEAAAADIAAATSLETQVREVSDLGADCGALLCLSLAESPLAFAAPAPGMVLVSVGPFYPEAQEIAPRLVAGATLVVSDHPDRLRRQWAGSPLLDVDALALASAADVIAGRARLGGSGYVVFLSDGRAFQDNVAAGIIHRAAVVAGRGLRLT
ncbi:MAG: hypothetical protein ACRCTI_13525 [Beijerinckiaceae bacterium]